MKSAILAFATLATMSIATVGPSLAAERGSVVQVQSGWDDAQGARPRHDQRRPGFDGGQYGRRDMGRQDVVSPRRVAGMLERRGFTVRDIRMDRGTYFVRAVRPNGRRVMLTIDARSGQIISERRIDGARRTGYGFD